MPSWGLGTLGRLGAILKVSLHLMGSFTAGTKLVLLAALFAAAIAAYRCSPPPSFSFREIGYFHSQRLINFTQNQVGGRNLHAYLKGTKEPILVSLGCAYKNGMAVYSQERHSVVVLADPEKTREWKLAGTGIKKPVYEMRSCGAFLVLEATAPRGERQAYEFRQGRSATPIAGAVSARYEDDLKSRVLLLRNGEVRRDRLREKRWVTEKVVGRIDPKVGQHGLWDYDFVSDTCFYLERTVVRSLREGRSNAIAADLNDRAVGSFLFDNVNRLLIVQQDSLLHHDGQYAAFTLDGALKHKWKEPASRIVGPSIRLDLINRLFPPD